MTRRAILATHRQLFLLLVGLGLLMRVLVPVGWMPHVSNGDVRLVLCAGYGPVAAQAPPSHDSTLGDHGQQATDTHNEHGQSPDQGQAELGAPCPFTLASAPALLLSSVAAVAQLPPVAVEARWIPRAVTRASRLAAPPPPAIGPPTA